MLKKYVVEGNYKKRNTIEYTVKDTIPVFEEFITQSLKDYADIKELFLIDKEIIKLINNYNNGKINDLEINIATKSGYNYYDKLFRIRADYGEYKILKGINNQSTLEEIGIIKDSKELIKILKKEMQEQKEYIKKAILKEVDEQLKNK